VKAAADAVVGLGEAPLPMTLATFEAALWTTLLALGRAVTALFFVRVAARHAPRATASHTSVIATLCGRVPFTRPVHGHARGRAQRPADKELGLRGGASFLVMSRIARFCAQMAFASARSTMHTVYQWKPSQDMSLRIVDALGSRARRFLEQAAVPTDDGEVLVLQVDARGAPMIDGKELAARRQPRSRTTGTARARRKASKKRRQRPRRKPGEKRKNAKGVVTGVMYTLRRTATGWEGPVNKRLYATLEGHEALFQWLHQEAVRRGYGKKKTLFLADGAKAIWKRVAQYFPKAKTCLDYYHVAEKLWVAGGCVHPEGSAEQRAWSEEQMKRLREGDVVAVLRALRTARRGIAKTGPGNKRRRERLKKVLKHLEWNRTRLNYAKFRRAGYEIATGAAEGAVRNLVELRLDGPGMRWGRERAERVLHLRCIHLNGQWEEFERWLQSDHVLEMMPHPIPAIAHNAVKKAA
jgi:hypothetical protein